ncbi:MAG: amidohydrolase family protein [Bacteroidetes bacterium]|nr:amidohydrolase family protein [Bacteroidota bacterium]
MKKILLSTSLILIVTCNLFSQSKIKAIKAGEMLDVVSGKILLDQIILIDNDMIIDIGPSVAIPAEAEIIDLSNATVLPGLIDCHTHLTSQSGGNYYEKALKETSIDNAIIVHKYAKITLEAGFTTVRDLGAGDLVDVSLRNAINEGLIAGPRMLVSTFPIGATGGHADPFTGFNPSMDMKGNPDFTGIANGIDEIKKRVRNNVKWGADNIKFMATAGVLSGDETVGGTQYSSEEMKALVDEAHMWGKKVAAHAHGTDGIKKAIIAGVNSVEHGSLLDAECIKLMKERGTYLVPTVYALESIVIDSAYKIWPMKFVNKARSISAQREVCFKRAFTSGVKIAYGTDAGVFPHGLNGKDFAYLVKYGLTPLQAIQSATINAADLLDYKAKAGTIAKGKFADIIAVEGNPLLNISILENVKFVMKGGMVYKNELKK